MYKVFFNDRTIHLVEDFSGPFARNNGLFCPYISTGELHRLIHLFRRSEDLRRLFVIHKDISGLQAAFRSFFQPMKAGGGLVINGEGSFLVILRRGKWDLPKGKLERGEDFETAAMREVEEETGLRGLALVAPLITTYHTYGPPEQPVLKETRWFEMRYTRKGPPLLQAEEEITDYRWVRPGEADFIDRQTYGSILDVLRLKGCISFKKCRDIPTK